MTLQYVQETSGQYGRFRLWGSLGFGIGGVIASIVVLWFPMSGIFVAAAIVYLISVLVTIKLDTGTQAPLMESRSSLSEQERLFTRWFLLFLFICFLLQIGNSFYSSFFGIYIHDLGGSQSSVGMAMLFSSLCELPFFYFVSTIVKRWGALRILLIASLFYALRWGLLAFFPSVWTALGSQLLHGFTFCLYFAAAMEFISTVVPQRFRTQGISVFTSVTAAAGMIGNLINGYLYDYHSISWILNSSTLFALLAAAGYWMIGNLNERSNSKLSL